MPQTHRSSPVSVNVVSCQIAPSHGPSRGEWSSALRGDRHRVGARAALVRKLNRLAAGTPDPSELHDVTYALWRQRHPELIPSVHEALRRIPSPASNSLRALLRLLEGPPEALRSWAEDASVPLEDKTEVLTVLDEEVPAELEPLLPAFISQARVGDEFYLTAFYPHLDHRAARE
jgi:hypothetical protein